MKNPRNIRLMYAIALLQGMVFYAPVASLYRQAAGLSLSQIALIEGISYLLCLAMELPWGMLADRIGYRRTMIVCCGFYLLSKIVFWQASDFAAFLLERVALSIALAGLSGVDESVLFLSCGGENSQRVFGRYDAFGTAGLMLSAGAYAAFIGKDYRLAALATAAAYALALLLAIGLAEVRPAEVKTASAPADFAGLLRQTLRRRRLLFFLLTFALFREAVQTATVWLNQNQYLRSGMSDAAIGWAYGIVASMRLAGALSQRLTRALGERRFAAVHFAAAAAGCMLLCFVRTPGLSVLCVGCIALSGAQLEPLTASILNRRAGAARRATQLSVFALLQNSAAAGASVALGRAADRALNAALILCAVLCLLGLAGHRALLRESAHSAEFSIHEKA